MEKIIITKNDIKKSDSYWSDYIGKEIPDGFDGHVEIESDLGYVRFTSLNVKGYILAKAGSGIEAGSGIKAGLSISCKLALKSKYRIFAGLCIWKNALEEEKVIECKRLDGGEIAYGTLKLIENI